MQVCFLITMFIWMSFLDGKMELTDGILKTSVYRKQTITGQYSSNRSRKQSGISNNNVQRTTMVSHIDLDQLTVIALSTIVPYRRKHKFWEIELLELSEYVLLIRFLLRFWLYIMSVKVPKCMRSNGWCVHFPNE